MFYEEQIQPVLRFGDVIEGVATIVPEVKDFQEFKKDLNVKINVPEYSVILTPCCSIEQQYISLCPLKKINRLLEQFYKNPYFKSNLTNINRLVPPENQLPPNKWKTLSAEKKSEKIDIDPDYTFFNYFIYAPNESLPTYNVKFKDGTIITGYYIINFKNAYNLKCNSISSAEKTPTDTKQLQLSVKTRSELRKKLGKYFSRKTVEDEKELKKLGIS